MTTLNDSGAVLGNVAYDPWGQVQAGTVPTFGFTGELQQGSNVYLRARWYTAQRGVFTAKDPFAGMPEQPYSLLPYQSFRWQTRTTRDDVPYSYHPYAYTLSNPINWTDPTGKCVPWLDANCEPLSWDQIRAGNLNWADARSYWSGVGQTAYGAVVGPVALLYSVATSDAARAQVRRGWDVLWRNSTGAVRTVADAALMPFTDIYNGIVCGDSNQLGRGLTGYALLLGGARLARGSVPRVDPQWWRTRSLDTSPFTENPFTGVRQASQYLRDQGIPRSIRKQVLESFERETIKVREAGQGEYGLRYYDNVNAFAAGRYLFETFPASRQSLALRPEWNQMVSVKQWQIRPGTTIIEGRAAAQGAWVGGQIQKYILKLEDLLEP